MNSVPSDVTALLRFHGAVPHEPAIDAWLAAQPEPLGAIATEWHARLRHAGADVRELLHDGCPTSCIGDAGFAYVNVFRHHVNLGFFQGAELPDPAGLLEGAGKHMRHVKLRFGVPVNVKALEALIAAAYADMTARVDAEAHVGAHTTRSSADR